MNEAKTVRVFLLVCGVGLIPIALGYGAVPSATMKALYGITVNELGQTHIMRVIMFLYFGMASLWLVGAFKPGVTGSALIACGVFMLSIAAGRLSSFAVDGIPHWYFVAFTIVEIVCGSLAIFFYRKVQSAGT